MSFKKKSNFLGTINGKNIAFDRLDYNLKGLPYRKHFVEQLLKDNDEFLVEYFDEYFKVNLSKDDALSEDNNICSKLEQIATYLLSESNIEKKETEYRFHTSEKNFERALRKEMSLHKLADDISGSSNYGASFDDFLDVLVDADRNLIKAKGIKVTDKDLERDDLTGMIIREYDNLKRDIAGTKEKLESREISSNNKLNVFKLKQMISDIDKDMYLVKYKLDRPIEFKAALKGETVPCWDDVDFLNPFHVECMLKIRANPNDFDSDLGVLMNQFNELYDKVKHKLNRKEREVLKVIKWGIKRVDKINDALKIGYDSGNVKELYSVDDGKDLDSIILKAVHLIIDEYERQLEKYLYDRTYNGDLFEVVDSKVCYDCGKRRTINSFAKNKKSLDGYTGICKCCRNKNRNKK